MTNYCSCGGKVALATQYFQTAEPDQEPFDNGFIEDVTREAFCSADEMRLEDPIRVTVNACVDCGKVYNAQIDEDFNEKYAKVVKRDVNVLKGDEDE